MSFLAAQEFAVLIERGQGTDQLAAIKKSLSASDGMAYADCEMQV